ncbi:hypothetical protein EIN_227480 [Entamoeba invadens IP1]|uniref:carnosine N-methyltransferase n=1 Tax=Entamoeba invadens IP1 TaxID=370355 RepID=A0A0A1U627_ENTIV|nr:hypothetical protein EIN_227480 [Entamoeba invadens IP1]ELP88335.1 hypothetical protein EIN_227480 [Entamoeba invadens IP1]|eukprot:XP_004255106.1 hypothetical protein EIN_227480 [Entamoeba invadens IP1]
MLSEPKSCCASCYYSFQNYVQDVVEQFEELITIAEEEDNDLLKDYILRMKEVRDLSETNTPFLESIVSLYTKQFKTEEDVEKSLEHSCCTLNKHNMSRISDVIQQTVREWSGEGSYVRDSCFRVLLDEIGTKKRVLVPGCGLARLPYELVKNGNECYACECNHYMILTLNALIQAKKEAFTICPYLVFTSDLVSSDFQRLKLKIPDVAPNEFLSQVKFSEEDFVTYTEKSQVTFDVVCTCYFMDTAFDAVEYITSIFKVLKSGGQWVNLGPLHWVNNCISSFHFTLEEIIQIAKRVGFTLVKNSEMKSTTYIPQRDCTTPVTYLPRLFIMSKP